MVFSVVHFRPLIHQPARILLTFACSYRRASTRIRPALGHAHQALSAPRVPRHRRSLAARARLRTRTRARPVATPAHITPGRRRLRPRLAYTPTPAPSALPHLPKRASHARGTTLTKPRAERLGSGCASRSSCRRTIERPDVQRFTSASTSAARARIAQNAPRARCHVVARGHAVERQRVAGIVTVAQVVTSIVSARAGIR